jgi:hypothetical protein
MVEHELVAVALDDDVHRQIAEYVAGVHGVQKKTISDDRRHGISLGVHVPPAQFGFGGVKALDFVMSVCLPSFWRASRAQGREHASKGGFRTGRAKDGVAV